MQSSNDLVARFRAEGRSITPQRQKIFEVLEGDRRHPTAESVHRAVLVDLPTVSLRTVYQTLNELAAMGELHPIELGTGSARFDPNTEPHDHLVCDRCGAVTDVVPGSIDPAVPIEAEGAFHVDRVEIVYRGRCVDCSG